LHSWGKWGLVVGERKSDGLQVFDVRRPGWRLAWLGGRKAVTQQRLEVDVFGDEVWAGGTDGGVRIWEIGGEGVVEPSWEGKVGGDAMGGLGLHPGGGVLASCCGSREFREWDEDEESGSDSEHSSASSPLRVPPSASETAVKTVRRSDNALKVWAL